MFSDNNYDLVPLLGWWLSKKVSRGEKEVKLKFIKTLAGENNEKIKQLSKWNEVELMLELS